MIDPGIIPGFSYICDVKFFSFIVRTGTANVVKRRPFVVPGRIGPF